MPIRVRMGQAQNLPCIRNHCHADRIPGTNYYSKHFYEQPEGINTIENRYNTLIPARRPCYLLASRQWQDVTQCRFWRWVALGESKNCSHIGVGINPALLCLVQCARILVTRHPSKRFTRNSPKKETRQRVEERIIHVDPSLNAYHLILRFQTNDNTSL